MDPEHKYFSPGIIVMEGMTENSYFISFGTCKTQEKTILENDIIPVDILGNGTRVHHHGQFGAGEVYVVSHKK